MVRLPDSERSRAVLIGTATYEDDSGFDQLPAVAQNLTLLSELLCDRTGIAQRNVRTLLNPRDQRAIRAVLRPAVDEAEDLLLFYFAGHGVWVPDSVGLAHVSSEANDPEWSTLRFELVKSMLRESAASVKIAILDCCHSGNALKHAMAAEDPGLALMDVAQVEGSFVLTATDGRRRWADARGTNGCTAFTGTLIDILRAGRSDDPEYMTMSHIYQRLRTSLKARNLPPPQASGRNSADSIALAQNGPSKSHQDSPTGAPQPGRIFAGYRMLELSGAGGMSQVYRALDRDGLPREVALKLVRSFNFDREARNRFLREAELVAMLDHPNIVTVFARGEEGGQLWIAMQYVSGPSVAQVLSQSGPIAPARAVQIIAEIAAALDHTHRNGVLHLDVKPANILLTRAEPERAMLTDFGIATSLEDQLQGDSGIAATYGYVAPERLSLNAVDHRADGYSLGCTLFEMLTAELPYPGDIASMMSRHNTALIPLPSERNIQLPEAFDSVIATALAKDPTARFASCGALAEAAREALLSVPNDFWSSPDYRTATTAGRPGNRAAKRHDITEPSSRRG